MKGRFSLLLLLACTLGCGINELLHNNERRDKERVAKIQILELQAALQLFSFDLGRYPMGDEGLEALLRNPGSMDTWRGPYLSKPIPRDPWGETYAYRCPGLHGDYDLSSFGADGSEGSEDDIVSWDKR